MAAGLIIDVLSLFPEMVEAPLGGNHPAIEKWKHGKSLERTRLNRPDLWRAWLKAHPEDAVE